MAKVLIPLATGFEEIEALTLVDILRRANIDVITAGLDNKSITGAHNITVKTDVLLETVDHQHFDMIVLPGGLPGTEFLVKSEKVQHLLKDFDLNNKLIGAICAAPWALATANVLKSSYTCYPSFEDTIKYKGYRDDLDVVCDENIMTSKGPATAMIFALEIVRKLAGKDKYLEIKSGLLL